MAMGRVLVVDNEPDLRGALRAYLGAHLPGTEVLEAADGRQALQVARSMRVDVVVTDFLMPGMDGLELLAAWHEIQPASRGMLLTAYPDATVAGRAVQHLGAGNVFAKPFDPWQIVVAVAQHLGVHALHGWGEGVAA